MTDDFREQFLEAMQEFGMAVEREGDVPTIDVDTLSGDIANAYSLPMVRNNNGAYSYAKVIMSAFVEAVVKSATEEGGFMEGVTQEEFDAIFN